jgi:hypothetical protein
MESFADRIAAKGAEMQMEYGSALSHGAGKRADSGLGAGLYQQSDGMEHDLDADRQMAQNLSVGFNVDARHSCARITAQKTNTVLWRE